MHRKENCSIPRLDLLDQSKFYIQHTKKLKKMKPSVETSVEPVNHFSVAHKEKEKEWKYADYISRMCYSQIQSTKKPKQNKRSVSNLSTSRRISNKSSTQKPQFNLRTNIFPKSPKGGIYNYSSSFDSSSLSASGMLSTYISPKTQIEEDGSMSPSTNVFLTQPKKKNYETYQYSNLSNQRMRQIDQDEPIEISIKDGMKFVEFSGESRNDSSNSNDELASRLNSKFRKSFFIGPADSSSSSRSIKIEKTKDTTNEYEFSPNNELKFNFHSSKKRNKLNDKSTKKNKKSKKSQLIDDFDNYYKPEKNLQAMHKRSIKLKVLKSLSYEKSFTPSIKWADQNDLLSQDEIDKNTNLNAEEGIIGNYANPIDICESSGSNSTRTAVNFTFDSDDDDAQIILEQSPLNCFEFYEFEISSQQHVLDIALNDECQSDDEKLENIKEKESITSKNKKEEPNANKNNEEEPNSNKNNDEEPNTNKNNDEEPNTNKNDDEEPNTNKNDDEEPNTNKNNDEEPNTNKNNDEEPNTNKNNDEEPNTNKNNEEEPNTNKNNEEELAIRENKEELDTNKKEEPIANSEEELTTKDNKEELTTKDNKEELTTKDNKEELTTKDNKEELTTKDNKGEPIKNKNKEEEPNTKENEEELTKKDSEQEQITKNSEKEPNSIQNNENVLEALPKQLTNLINGSVKKDVINNTYSDYDYSYYSDED